MVSELELKEIIGKVLKEMAVEGKSEGQAALLTGYGGDARRSKIQR